MSQYFIKLKPLNSFYFGSINSFQDQENGTHYFLKSNLYPQQTAVLGMIRKKILEDNGILVPRDKRNKEQLEREKEYIGEVTADLSGSSFGKIKKMTSIQIYSKETPYLALYRTKFQKDKVLTNKGEKYLLYYDPKKFSQELVSLKDNSSEALVLEMVDIGIHKTHTKKGFFKKQRYQFKDSESYFGFLLEVEEGIRVRDGVVQLGDRHSIFHMSVNKVEKEVEFDIKSFDISEDTLLFCSDVYLEKEDLEKILVDSEGMLFQNNKFKFIVRKAHKYTVQEKVQNLIQRGSLLKLDKAGKILEILQNKKYDNYKKIGFNHFVFGKGGK